MMGQPDAAALEAAAALLEASQDLRDKSPDGWTRKIELDIAVADAPFWNGQARALAEALAFLTTDRWALQFHEGGMLPTPPREPVRPPESCVVLLSGGLDSLIGAIDLTAAGHKPFAISQTVRGDADKQVDFAAKIGGGLGHLQLNHNAHTPGVQEASQRARSLVFITFGVIAATALKAYREVAEVPLFVCENGFIAINPPLTGGRLGSLSTRTAHPEFLARLQKVLDAAGLRVKITNPYATKTKGEMLQECADQNLLGAEAARSTSCGRFQRFNYRQIAHERKGELPLFERLLPQVRYVGEIGLDGGPEYRRHWLDQEHVFTRVLSLCARVGGRVMSIHSRRASTQVLDALVTEPSAGIAILHWFSGTQRELARAVDLGCWFSVGPAMLAGDKGRALAAKMPRDRILTETDGPFAQVDGRAAWPWDADRAVEALSQIWSEPVNVVQRQLASNLRRLTNSSTASD